MLGLVGSGPTGDIAVKLSFTSCATFSYADTVCQNWRITVLGLRHVANAYPCVGFTRNYSAAGFAQGFMLLWIRRSNLRLSERVCAVHYSVGVQSIDLGVR